MSGLVAHAILAAMTTTGTSLEDLGSRIRQRRERLGLKQIDLANALQITTQAVSKWERGENAPDVVTLGPLAHLLGVSVDFLLGLQSAGGDVFEATVFASSVNGYTARAETLDLADLATWTNGLLSLVTECVTRHGGIPIKALGDGLLACFAGHAHRERGLAAALGARAAVTDPVVVGLASGPVHLTSIGHPDYARPDILSPVVNLAFRVLGWATRIGASAETLAGLEDRYDLGAGEPVALKGIADPVVLYEVRGRRQEQ